MYLYIKTTYFMEFKFYYKCNLEHFTGFAGSNLNNYK